MGLPLNSRTGKFFYANEVAYSEILMFFVSDSRYLLLGTSKKILPRYWGELGTFKPTFSFSSALFTDFKEVSLEDFPLYLNWESRSPYIAGLLDGSITVEWLLNKYGIDRRKNAGRKAL